MSYRLTGKIDALVGADCREPLAGSTVQLFTPTQDVQVQFALLPKEQVRVRQARLLASEVLDDDGRFSIDLPGEAIYDGGPLEVGLRAILPEDTGKKPTATECTLLTFTPIWQPSNTTSARECIWQYALPTAAWAEIRQHLGAYVIVGRLSARDGIAPLAGVQVTAFDVDMAQDDVLGRGTTDVEGSFRINYSASAMGRTPVPGVHHEPGSADVYFTAERDSRRLLDEPRAAGRRRDRRNVGPSFCVRLRTAAAPLTLSIDTPAPGRVTNQSQLPLTGRASESCLLELNDQPLALDGDNRFTTQVTLTEGNNSLVLKGIAKATGAQTRRELSVILDTSSPAPPDLTLITVVLDDDATTAHLRGAAAAIEPSARVDIVNTRTREQTRADSDTEGAFAAILPAVPGDTLSLTTRDAADNASSSVQLIVSGKLPPDPAHVAPPLPTTTITPLAQATAFLYTSPNPIQTGTDPDTFESYRVAVLRGRVTTPAGSQLPGVAVTVAGHPEYGQTLSRADGHYDLVVNGGTQLTLNYAKEGCLRAQRPVTVPWQDYLSLPDVALIQPDSAVSAVDLTVASPAQLIRASTITDHDGTRRATLFIPAATTATMELPDGTSRRLEQAHIRITEYTVGDGGPAAMPADLPPASAYTYAVACRADEAAQAGARSLHFSQPVVLYVENFLGFPPGGPVPLGSYDLHTGQWTAEPDGRVITLLATTGTTADLDVTGDGQPDPADAVGALGITEEERAHLAATYPPGQQLWRTPLAHFCPQDCNWPAQPEQPGAEFPSQPNAKPEPLTKDGCNLKGSILDVDNQVLQERLPLVGTGLSLCYSSARTEGFTPAYRLRIPLTPESPPKPLRRVELTVKVEGRQFRSTYPPGPSLVHTFIWDGKDAAGRPVQGARPVTITIGYVYKAVYTTPADFERSFGLIAGSGKPSGGSSRRRPITDATRKEITLTQSYTTIVGAWTAPREAGLGGWSLNLHHTYDPLTQTLYLGNGRQRQAEPFSPVITTISGTGQAGHDGDGGPASEALIGSLVRGMAVAADGSLYFSDTANNRVRCITPDGIVTNFAGAPARDLGDGGPATAARLIQPGGLALAPDGTLYVLAERRVRAVAPDGIITTLADLNGITNQPLYDLALGPDGSLYVSETGRRVLRITPDGQLSVFAGDGDAFRDNVPATETKLDAHGMVFSPDGSFYVADFRQSRIRRITPDGTVTTFAGTWPGDYGDGGPATKATLEARALVRTPDGTFYTDHRTRATLRAIRPDGIITTIAGNGQSGSAGDGQRATNAQLSDPEYLALAPDGSLYISGAGTCRIRKIASPYPGFTAGAIAIPSDDGQQVYVFDPRRRHTHTLNAYTGAALTTFHYDDNDRLATVVHGDPAESNTVTITRDANGQPTAITGPDGHQTQLPLHPDGYLDRLIDPSNAITQLTYHPGGLLATRTDPLGHRHTYSYEPDGRLSVDTAPGGVRTALAAKRDANGHTATALTTEGRESTYSERQQTDGTVRRTVRCCGEHEAVSTVATDGTQTDTSPDGTTYTRVQGPDPRWGMQTPLTTEATLTTPDGIRQKKTKERTADLAQDDNPLSLTRENNRTTIDNRQYTTQFDASTRTWTHTSPGGLISRITTDPVNRILTAQTGSLAALAARYDERGRLDSLSQGAGPHKRTWQCSYSPRGDLAEITDPAGRTTSLSYNAAGRPETITARNGSSTLIEYDPTGKIISITPSGRPPHSFEYHATGDLSTYRPPHASDAESTHYTYDADRILKGIIRAGGNVTELLYDEAGRLNKIRSSDHVNKYTYLDGSRRLATATTPDGNTLTYTYDGPLCTGETWGGLFNGSVQHAYGNRLLPTSQKVNTEAPVGITYDDDDRTASVGEQTISYDSATGLCSGSKIGQIDESWRYNEFGEPIEHRVANDGGDICVTSYTRDLFGRVESQRETIAGNAKECVYTYDELGRLSSTSIDGVTASYSYDNGGNRTRVQSHVGVTTAKYNEQGQLLTLGKKEFTYTPEGDLETATEDGHSKIRYRYDPLGRLIRVELPDGQNVDYSIDALGRRIARSLNGKVSSAYLYDGLLRPVAELDSESKVVARFVYNDRSDTPTYIKKGDRSYFVASDHLGSPRAIIDTDTGEISQQIEYSPWGEILSDTNPGFQPFGFAGGLYDPLTELVLLGRRSYDPSPGRWTSKDPIGDVTSWYVYCGNDPVNRVDPSGLSWDSVERLAILVYALMAGTSYLPGGDARAGKQAIQAMQKILEMREKRNKMNQTQKKHAQRENKEDSRSREEREEDDDGDDGDGGSPVCVASPSSDSVADLNESDEKFLKSVIGLMQIQALAGLTAGTMFNLYMDTHRGGSEGALVFLGAIAVLAGGPIALPALALGAM
ncbi:RHS repeat-associated core domain-containing protein [Streptomyces sp. NPDC057694]|uniref:NHL domain-containing protein n=1 Tax=Streptomyces sp. NPDC057694 TaxID=3346216 RepID=UPI003698014A